MKQENPTDDAYLADEAAYEESDQLAQAQSSRLQRLIEESSLERLEANVKVYQSFLDSLKSLLAEKASQHKDAGHFSQQIGVTGPFRRPDL